MDNFIVSARKYRPATFRSVVGQAHITSTLQNAITRGQLAHAYLFCGPRGVGKTTCARIFAKAINCLSPVDGEACNTCESCRAFNEGRSFSIHELDAASNNSVDDIRNLTDQVRIPPQIGRYSVYIIDEVHMLSLSAFNAFLKTLEEPPAHAVFILATTEKHKIIPTILSRCQIYDFNRIRVEDGVEYLKYIAAQEQVVFDDEALHIIAQKADGGMRDALSMFDKVVSFGGGSLTAKTVAETLNVLDYDTYFTMVDLILQGSYAEVLIRFDEVLRKGFGGQTFIAGLNEHMRNLLMCKNPQTVPLLEVTGSVAKRFVEQSQKASLAFLFESVNLLTGQDAGFRTATNQRLHVELGLMKLCGMGQKKNVVDTPAENKEEFATAYPVPVLPVKNPGDSMQSPAVSAPAAPPQPQPAPSAQPTQGQVQNHPSLKQPHPASVSSAPAPTTQAASLPPKPAPTGTSITGFSLKDALSVPAAPATEAPAAEEERPSSDSPVVSDEETEQRLSAVCATLSERFTQSRPRLATAFSRVSVKGSRIGLTVPNENLKEEVERHMLDLKRELMELSDVTCAIEFDIAVEADASHDKPVKADDKLKFLSEQNAHLTAFRQALHLDIE